MKTLFKIAIRNLRRHAKRNRFTLASIASGLGVLFWIQSILHAHSRSMIEIATETFTGDVQVYRHGFLENKSVTSSFEPEKVDALMKEVPGALATRRLHFPAILASGEDSAPMLLLGIEPLKESRITTLKKNLVEGSFLEPESAGLCEKKQIYIGSAIARRLNVGLGEKLVVMGQAANGTLGNDLFRVIGIYESGSADFDRTYAFTDISCAGLIAAVDDRVHEQVIKLEKTLAAQAGSDLRLQRMLQESLGPELQVTTWREAVPALATMTRFHAALVGLITVIFFLVITLGVVNAMLMNIFERTKEFGVMLSLGTTPNQVRALILTESLMMGLLAAGIGTVLGVALISYHSRFGFDISPFVADQGRSFVGYKIRSMIYPMLEWGNYLKLVAVELVFIIAAGIYPAHRAATLDPVVTLRS